MVCIGEESCYGTWIESVANIEANGNNVLAASKIVSNLGDFDEHIRTLTIRINGSHDEAFDVYCNETDTCNIDCQSKSACATLNLHCDGECNVHCDELGGIDCPIKGAFHIWKTLPPTGLPTSYPSLLPSTMPSKYPTIHPTAEPTVYSTPITR